MESINLSVVSIHATFSQWAAAPSAKMAHGPEGSCVYYPQSIKVRYRCVQHNSVMQYISDLGARLFIATKFAQLEQKTNEKL
jgi:hypothetical protein